MRLRYAWLPVSVAVLASTGFAQVTDPAKSEKPAPSTPAPTTPATATGDTKPTPVNPPAPIESQETAASFQLKRQRHGITRTTPVANFPQILGTRFIEVRGTLRGHIKLGENWQLLLDQGQDDTIAIAATSVPDWIIGDQTEARLILRAQRETAASELRLTLIAALPAHQLADLVPPAPRPPAKAPARTNTTVRTNRGRSATSRSNAGRSWVVPASEVVPIYAQFVRAQNPKLPAGECHRIAQGVVGFSVRYGVDARLIMAVIMVESGFNPNATSRAGAGGLGQLMPRTAAGLGVRNRYDSIENLYGMIKHMRRLLEKYIRQTGDHQRGLVLALAAYNAGEGAVLRHGGVPPFRETQNYVRKVTTIYRRLTGGD